jgi:hypothetical protein
MPLSDGQYAKFSFLLQDQPFRILRSITGLRRKPPTPSHFHDHHQAKIIRRAQNMDELTTALRAALPSDAGQSLLAANLREDGELVLVCASSAWAARLRFESDKLMDVVRKSGLRVSSCRVSVSQET